MGDILKIQVKITGAHEVKGTAGEAVMLAFEGTAESDYFKGKVLSGGVDTQKEFYPERRTLSARYMLEGVDDAGQQCHIFIENNGTTDENGMVSETHPIVITDSKSLAWMEKAPLKGTLEPAEGGVIVHIGKAGEN